MVALTASQWAVAQTALLNVSYDVSREFYKDINTAFVANYKKTTGKDIKIDQSHAGSSAQARAVTHPAPGFRQHGARHRSLRLAPAPATTRVTAPHASAAACSTRPLALMLRLLSCPKT